MNAVLVIIIILGLAFLGASPSDLRWLNGANLFAMVATCLIIIGVYRVLR